MQKLAEYLENARQVERLAAEEVSPKSRLNFRRKLRPTENWLSAGRDSYAHEDRQI